MTRINDHDGTDSAAERATTVDDALWELGHASPFAAVPGLDRMRALLARLGDPQIGLPVVHIGGTAGKGSTATLVAAILRAAGYRVGLHTKPHLAQVNERIVVNGVPVSDTDLHTLIVAATPAARAVEPTWYELTVALALLHFRRVGVDIAVIEVGLGGTWDGTNVVEPRVAVLTNVGLDHTEVLGDTVELIAADKVGIFKPGCVVVSGVTQPSVRKIVTAKAAAVGAPLWLLDRDFSVHDVVPEADGTRFALDLHGTRTDDLHDLHDLRISLRGAHQVTNAALAVAAVTALAPSGYPVMADAIRRGLADARLPGRLEVVGESPITVLDGAHNPDKLAALLTALGQYFTYRRLVVVVAFTLRHDYRAMLAQLVPVADRIVLTQFTARGDFGPGSSVPPADLAATLAEIAPAATVTVTLEPDALAAVHLAQTDAGAAGCVCVTGSLYLVGAVRASLLATASEIGRQ